MPISWAMVHRHRSEALAGSSPVGKERSYFAGYGGRPTSRAKWDGHVSDLPGMVIFAGLRHREYLGGQLVPLTHCRRRGSGPERVCFTLGSCAESRTPSWFSGRVPCAEPVVPRPACPPVCVPDARPPERARVGACA